MKTGECYYRDDTGRLWLAETVALAAMLSQMARHHENGIKSAEPELELLEG